MFGDGLVFGEGAAEGDATSVGDAVGTDDGTGVIVGFEEGEMVGKSEGNGFGELEGTLGVTVTSKVGEVVGVTAALGEISADGLKLGNSEGISDGKSMLGNAEGSDCGVGDIMADGDGIGTGVAEELSKVFASKSAPPPRPRRPWNRTPRSESENTASRGKPSVNCALNF